MTLPTSLPDLGNIAFGTHYRITGTGRPVLFIHDLGRDLSMWDPLLPSLLFGSCVIRYDLLGHGRSAKPRGELSWRQWQAQLEMLVDYLKIEDATVVGFGFGADLARSITEGMVASDRHLSLALESFLAESTLLITRAA
jgi:(E)-2-((N-methylformamido)methylene)succinate hydrolase